MAIDTYAKLQSEILDTLDRNDLVSDVSEYTPGTIEGAVKRAIAKTENRILRRVKTNVFEASTSVSTVAGTETISLPSDYAMMKMLAPTGTDTTPLAQKDLTTLNNDNPSTATGTPKSYAPFGTLLYLRPIPASVIVLKMFYYLKPSPLSASNTSNAILTNYPDLLLYGSLIELTAHLEDNDNIQTWKGFFDEGIKDITNDNTLNRWSGTPIRAAIDARLVV